MKRVVCIAVVLLVAAVVRAERPPESREEADLVVTGKVTKLATKKKGFGGDGVMTTYTATVKVDKVEKGKAKPGDAISVTWFHVTKTPSKAFPGAYGQDHKVKQKDEATFWLMKNGKDNWSVIYNDKGVEKKAKE